MEKFINKQNLSLGSLIREVVFGVEDGLVSTLGSITGIAIGSGDRFTVLLAGIVIICVESISMGVGSYLSNKTSKEYDDNRVKEEKKSITKEPEDEKTKDLVKVFIGNGWPRDIAQAMAEYAASDNRLILTEYKAHAMGIGSKNKTNPVVNGAFMYVAYNVGGLIPLLSYFILPVSTAIYFSVFFSLFSLFLVGVLTTKFTKASWLRSGLRIFILGGIALFVGIIIGELVSSLSVYIV